VMTLIALDACESGSGRRDAEVISTSASCSNGSFFNSEGDRYPAGDGLGTGRGEATEEAVCAEAFPIPSNRKENKKALICVARGSRSSSRRASPPESQSPPLPS